MRTLSVFAVGVVVLGCGRAEHPAVPSATLVSPATRVVAAAPDESARPVLAQVTPEATSTQSAASTSGERTRDISFDDIKFKMEKKEKFKRSMLTEKIEKLSGKTVKIRGYIFPGGIFKQKGITKFVLVRDNQECCFGPGAALFDCVIVRMKPGKSTDFSVRPIAVEGKFSIREFRQGKKLRAVYAISGDSAK